jgi:hypothetical protein
VANMWYDKFVGLPPRGSLLESIMVLVRVERQRAQMMETRAIVQSIVGLHESKKTQDPAVQAFQEYCAKMEPQLDGIVKGEKQAAIDALKEFVKRPAKIDLHPIYKQRAEHAKRMATVKRFRLKPKSPGTI